LTGDAAADADVAKALAEKLSEAKAKQQAAAEREKEGEGDATAIADSNIRSSASSIGSGSGCVRRKLSLTLTLPEEVPLPTDASVVMTPVSGLKAAMVYPDMNLWDTFQRYSKDTYLYLVTLIKSNTGATDTSAQLAAAGAVLLVSMLLCIQIAKTIRDALFQLMFGSSVGASNEL